MILTFFKHIAVSVLFLASSLANGSVKSVSEQLTLVLELSHIVDNNTGRKDRSSDELVDLFSDTTIKVSIYDDNSVIIDCDKGFSYNGTATDNQIAATAVKVIGHFSVTHKLKIDRFSGRYTLLVLGVNTESPSGDKGTTQHGICRKKSNRLF